MHATAQPPATPPAPHYRVSLPEPRSQTFCITLTLEQPAAIERLSLPVWIAGSYLVREFSRHLHSLSAERAGHAAEVVQRHKNTWEIHCPPALDEASATAPLVIRWRVVACDASVRAAWLSAERGFFNPTSLLLRSPQREHGPHRLTLEPPPGAEFAHWQLASAARAKHAGVNGWGTYIFENYEDLADTPFEMGTFWSAEFEARGVPHRFVVAGAPASFDGPRLVRDAQRICETLIDFWHPGHAKSLEKSHKDHEICPETAQTPSAKKAILGRGLPESLAHPPHDRYVFLLNVAAGGYGGLEHRHSTALICDYGDLPRLNPSGGESPSEQTAATGGYRALLGLISHEYFHTWNVKRLRPLELQHIDFERENLTHLLWFFEGLTSYYDDLLLRRAGLIDEGGYLQLLGKTFASVCAAPGRHIQSSAQASFEAWTKYYRPDEHSPNTSVSYYTKGALIGLCLDLQLRRMSAGTMTLDHVMRTLWLRSAGGPIGERDVLEALLDLSPAQPKLQTASELENPSENKALETSPTPPLPSAEWPELLHDWVHGTQDLPVQALLAQFGVRVQWQRPTLAQRLGLRVHEKSGQAIEIKHVLRDGAGEAAGFLAHDRFWAVELGAERGTWAVHALDDLETFAANETAFVALVQRGQRVLRLPVQLPDAKDIFGTPELIIEDAQKLRDWLHGPEI